MRRLAAVLLIAIASPGQAFDLFRWPDPDIRIPPRVQSFIVAECVQARGFAEETVDQCIRAERYGYQAVVTMLTEEETGQRAVERYRICSGGLGSLGGKFHRRKATCIGKPLEIVWRFEFMQKAETERDTRIAEAGELRPDADTQGQSGTQPTRPYAAMIR